MKKTIFLFFLILIVSCAEKSPPEFSLTGTTNEIENGTYLYLHNMVANKTIDSALVENNKFEFLTDLQEVPLWVMLHTKDRSLSRPIWLEDNAMIFDGTNSDFKHAAVTGSESEILHQELIRIIDTAPQSELDGVFKKFVRDHPKSIVSAFILSNHSSFWGHKLTAELYGKFPQDVKNSFFGKRIETYLAKDIPQIGDHFLNISMIDPNGYLKELSDLKGKIILLEFWASWCKPCRKENPRLVKTYKKFKPKGFEIFAVSLDTNKKYWIEAIKEDGLKWQHVSDLKGRKNEAVLLYGVGGIPDNLLIDRSGTIVARNVRGEDLNHKLSELLAEQ